MTIPVIQELLESFPELEFAVLVGSRATDRFRPDSDWDIAIQWSREISFQENLYKTESLRRKLAQGLNVTEDRIDLIDLPRAGLAMRAMVAEEGVVLKGEDSIAWHHFLLRVWRELEDYDWEMKHAI